MFRTWKYERSARICVLRREHARTRSPTHFPWLCPLTSCSPAQLQEASVPRGGGSDSQSERLILHSDCEVASTYTHFTSRKRERGGPRPALFHPLYTALGSDKHALTLWWGWQPASVSNWFEFVSLSYSSAEQSVTITWGAARKLEDIICNIKTTLTLLCSLLSCVFAAISQMFSTMCKPGERSHDAWGSRRESESDGSPQLFSAKPQWHVKFKLICVEFYICLGGVFCFSLVTMLCLLSG